MPDPNFILRYVANPAVSAGFYTDLLGRPPIESSPTFCMFALESGVMLGLWARDTVLPAAGVATGGGELAFAVADIPAVEALHQEWRGRGLDVVQAPAAMDFGYTFVALDPDGHRLRVFAPSA